MGLPEWWRGLTVDLESADALAEARASKRRLDDLGVSVAMDEEETRLLADARRSARKLDGERKTSTVEDRLALYALCARLDVKVVHTLEGPELLAELAKEVERPHRRLSGAAFTEAEALLAAARAAGFAPTSHATGSTATPDATAASGQPLGPVQAILIQTARMRAERRRREQLAAVTRVNFLTWLGGIVAVLLVATVFAIDAADDTARTGDLLLAIAAGALGASLSGALKLRSEQTALTNVERLGAGLIVQPLLGAVGGVIVFTIWTTELFTIAALSPDSWASVMTVAFAGGFSEPFLFKIVGRVTDAADSRR